MSRSMERIVTSSRGKMESICRIASWEYASMREELRMLILTDYVRKEAEMALGDLEKEVGNIGVLPVFELLRRQAADWRLGALCGSLLIFPDSGKKRFWRKQTGRRRNWSRNLRLLQIPGESLWGIQRSRSKEIYMFICRL